MEECHEAHCPAGCHHNCDKWKQGSVHCLKAEVKGKKHNYNYQRNKAGKVCQHKDSGILHNRRVSVNLKVQIVTCNFLICNFCNCIKGCFLHFGFGTNLLFAVRSSQFFFVVQIIRAQGKLHLSSSQIVVYNNTIVHCIPFCKAAFKLFNIFRATSVSVWNQLAGRNGTIRFTHKINMSKRIYIINFVQFQSSVCNLSNNVDIFWSEDCTILGFHTDTDNHHASKLLFCFGKPCIRSIFLRKELADRIINCQVLDEKSQQSGDNHTKNDY